MKTKEQHSVDIYNFQRSGMTSRESELRKLYRHLQYGDAEVESYFTYRGERLSWTAKLYGGGDEYIACECFGRYSVRNTMRQFRWLLWSMLNIHGQIKWSKI